MRRGGGKQKGGQFEREVAKDLSLWLTDGKRKDCLWRSAMSGGRATLAQRKGEINRQGGDLSAVAEEAYRMMGDIIIECKFLKDCNLDTAFMGKGDLIPIWKKLCMEAARSLRFPVLVLKRNNKQTLVITCDTVVNILGVRVLGTINHTTRMSICLYSDVLERPVPRSWKNARKTPEPKAVLQRKTGAHKPGRKNLASRGDLRRA